MDTNYSLSDIAAATGNGRNDGMWGGDGAWWLILFILFGMFGWGGFGGGYGGGGATNTPGFQGWATRSDIDAALSTQGIENGIQNISTQLCNGFNTLGSQMANCCCDLKQGQGEINYNMAAQTNILQNTVNNGLRDVIENQTAGVQRIIDTITQDKIQSLQTELQSAQLQLSNQAQTTSIINALRPTPTPSYPVMSPYTSIINPTGFTFGVNGCGCNTGCGCC
ncbi:MAG TPA: hypothetical protein H9717_02130 [Candidatus Eisenbergiella merdipullorum]|uniref:Uncharacterized protein n=1 Tax=Candidatus Eisenbergiella merdipullorum TaxID=2838553 RepID=A0A9D2I281_9FIRM|nr:hypothetical protein [Candidatus Eisenbergiella merdipullorum]